MSLNDALSSHSVSIN